MLEADVDYVHSASGIQLFHNGRRKSFNFEYGQLTSRIDLLPGENTIRIIAKNQEGEAHANCLIERKMTTLVRPQIIVHNPPSDHYPTDKSTFNLVADILEVRNRRDIDLQFNGSKYQSF